MSDLLGHWDDAYDPESEAFLAAFTEAEPQAMDEYDELCVPAVRGRPRVMTVAEYLETPQWERLAELARKRLQALGENPPPS